MFIFVASYGNEKKIYILSINKNGKINYIGSKKLKGYPSYISSYKRKLAISMKDINNDGKGGLVICKKNENLDIIYENLEPTSYTHVFEDSKYILMASYHQGLIKIINKKDNSVYIKKYPNGKIHNVGNICKNKYYGVDLSNGQIYIYTIIKGRFIESQSIILENNINPRHLICTNHGKNLYVVSENTSEILVYSMKDDGKYSKIQSISTIIKSNNSNMASAIRRFKKYIFVSNRGEDTISLFIIEKDGRLRMLRQINTTGECPRDFNVSRSCKFLIVANEDSDNIKSFFVDYKNKKIILKDSFDIDKPVCIEM